MQLSVWQSCSKINHSKAHGIRFCDIFGFNQLLRKAAKPKQKRLCGEMDRRSRNRTPISLTRHFAYSTTQYVKYLCVWTSVLHTSVWSTPYYVCIYLCGHINTNSHSLSWSHRHRKDWLRSCMEDHHTKRAIKKDPHEYVQIWKHQKPCLLHAVFPHQRWCPTPACKGCNKALRKQNSLLRVNSLSPDAPKNMSQVWGCIFCSPKPTVVFWSDALSSRFIPHFSI